MLLALLLALAAHRPDPALVHRLMRMGFERYDAEQVAAMSPADRRQAILGLRICGPDGAEDFDPDPRHPAGYPHCNRNGWNGRSYGKEMP